MNMIKRIRLYHATLGILSILAYLTREIRLIHVWLGYGVAAAIAFRLLWALSGEHQVSLMRFYPSFKGLGVKNIFIHPAISKTLILGIALSLIAVTFTGITMDKSKEIGLASVEMVSTAYADDDREEQSENEEKGLMTEAHELSANLLLLFVGMHVTYLLMFKRPLSKFMLFIPKSVGKDGASPRK
jgi:3-ketosteroid 9alpha-monooxygenase subunit B